MYKPYFLFINIRELPSQLDAQKVHRRHAQKKSTIRINLIRKTDVYLIQSPPVSARLNVYMRKTAQSISTCRTNWILNTIEEVNELSDK